MELTVVVGLDAATLEQWELSLPTIVAYRPELLANSWTIFYDWRQVGSQNIIDVAEANGLNKSPHLRFVPWPDGNNSQEYPSQRAKMLAGFVHVPAGNVKTDWWLKIDTDVTAVESPNPWMKDEWFDDNVLVASPWGYGKPKGDSRTAMQWARELELWGDWCWPHMARLNLDDCIQGNKIVKPRFWSPVSFYRSSWTFQVSALCEEHYGSGGLPVPSQDSVHWYAAERSQVKYKKVQMKRHGWEFHSKTSRLRDAVERILAVS
jgi:hypothetical protein